MTLQTPPTKPAFLPDREFSISGPVVSGDRSSEILYQFRTCDRGIFIFPADPSIPDASDYIYFRDWDSEPSRGFGGRSLTFKTPTGSITVQGPWKSNPDGLFEFTGVDLRDSCLTIGIVALEEHHIEFGRARYSGVLHADDAPVNGSYARIRDIAQRFADELQRPVHHAMRARGGGHMGLCRPQVSLSNKKDSL